MQAAAETAFELPDESTATAAEDLLGTWRVGPPAPGVAFAAAGSANLEAPLWRIDLPTDPGRAAGRLEAGHARVRAASDQLADVPALLDAALDRDGAGVAFTAEPPVPGVSEASEAAELVGWERLTSGCRPSAWVETRIQGEPVARSLLGLGGGVHTVCRPGLGRGQARLHGDGVRLVVESRAALLRVVACVTRGAVAISVRLALPGGAVLAIPLAWRFVRRVLAEVDRGGTRSP
jgi:hypothetical protein